MSKINWDKEYKAIIERVYERGNEEEKKEIEAFYGLSKIKTVLRGPKRATYTIYKNKQKI